MSDEAKKRSFERSLAGPSVGKAGLQRDQTDINRVIADASKGSKFYNNQVRKDEELNRKIVWFQEKRQQLEREAERIMLEVEATRDLSQTIVHVDMDAFVQSGLDRAYEYEARKFGIRSGMAEFIARKLCPDIIIVKNNFELYIEASKAVREVLIQYDENLMMASLDEGYLNITPYMAEYDMTAAQVVTQLRSDVESATQLTISAGIAPNKMLAKICSDKNKPNGQFELEFDRAAITRFMRDLPVRRVPGFGRVTERCLEGLGVETCGDIYTKRCELLVMDHWFGFRGLCRAHLGLADNAVAPAKREERKSVGVERTFRDKTDDSEILATLADIAKELEEDLERLQYAGKTITVKFKLHTFESAPGVVGGANLDKTRAQSVKKWISTSDEILPIAEELLKRELPLRIRLLGIRLSTLRDLAVPDTGIRNFLKKVETRSEVDVGPKCPICGKTLSTSISNQAVNEHIDLCLSRDMIDEEPPIKKPKRPPTIDAWLNGNSKAKP